jgi:signal transduction histidine kinase
MSDEPIDLSALLEHCTRNLGPLLDQSTLNFKAEIASNLPLIRGDRERLQQVIQNLLNNALKFTPHGGITLRAFDRGGEVCIAVADTGLGIARKDQQRVFEKSSRLATRSLASPRAPAWG